MASSDVPDIAPATTSDVPIAALAIASAAVAEPTTGVAPRGSLRVGGRRVAVGGT
jgi:hypothetical protein